MPEYECQQTHSNVSTSTKSVKQINNLRPTALRNVAGDGLVLAAAESGPDLSKAKGPPVFGFESSRQSHNRIYVLFIGYIQKYALARFVV